MIVQCMKCNQHYENGIPPIALSAAGHFCPMEPIVVSAPQPQAGTVAAQGEAVALLDLVKRAAFYGWQHSSWDWANVAMGCEEAAPEYPFRVIPTAAPVPADEGKKK